jgi:hypothetical protein
MRCVMVNAKRGHLAQEREAPAALAQPGGGDLRVLLLHSVLEGASQAIMEAPDKVHLPAVASARRVTSLSLRLQYAHSAQGASTARNDRAGAMCALQVSMQHAPSQGQPPTLDNQAVCTFIAP